jgi:NDP-sugar pyrophosphorylase family protein
VVRRRQSVALHAIEVKITQAFVLGAGLGTRLRPLTDDLPKPLVPIFQKPLITFAFDHLIAAGIEKLVVNTHRLPERFAETFPDGLYRGRGVEFLHEPDLLETGGGIKNAERFLGTEPFIVYSGDILTDLDLAPLIEQHFKADNDVTLALRETGLATGIAWRDGRVIDINARYGNAGHLDFANISIWSPSIFERIPPHRKISFIPIVLDWIGQGGKIGGVILNDGKWFNIGSAAEYSQVHRMIAGERWKPAYVTAPEWPASIAADAIVDPSAQLIGTCSLGAKCSVAADAILEDTIVWPHAQIASRTRLRNCIVRSHHTAEGDLSDTII